MLTREESPVSSATDSVYNEHVVLEQETDARGITVHRDYDALNRLLSVSPTQSLENREELTMSLENALQLVHVARGSLEALLMSLREKALAEGRDMAAIEETLVKARAEAEAVLDTMVARIKYSD